MCVKEEGMQEVAAGEARNLIAVGNQRANVKSHHQRLACHQLAHTGCMEAAGLIAGGQHGEMFL